MFLILNLSASDQDKYWRKMQNFAAVKEKLAFFLLLQKGMRTLSLSDLKNHVATTLS